VYPGVLAPPLTNTTCCDVSKIYNKIMYLAHVKLNKPVAIMNSFYMLGEDKQYDLSFFESWFKK